MAVNVFETIFKLRLGLDLVTKILFAKKSIFFRKITMHPVTYTNMKIPNFQDNRQLTKNHRSILRSYHLV